VRLIGGTSGKRRVRFDVRIDCHCAALQRPQIPTSGPRWAPSTKSEIMVSRSYKRSARC
jgi:hypothetical protein